MLHQGVEVLEGVAVESIQTKNNAISSVTTNKGAIDCEIFVNCAGQVRRGIPAVTRLKVDQVVASRVNSFVLHPMNSIVDNVVEPC